MAACIPETRASDESAVNPPAGWTGRDALAISRATRTTADESHEANAAADLYLVERPDHWHALPHLALRREGRPGRIRQYLLPHQGWGEGQGAGPTAALGGL